MRDFSGAKRIVVKVGTNVLTKDGKVDTSYIKDIAKQVSKLIKAGKKILLVSSGAIGFGSMKLGLKRNPQDVKMRQALAGIGQSILMHEYAKAFSKHKVEVAQVLVTYDIMSGRKTYLNLKDCVETLLKMNVVPIVNENDVVSTKEIGTGFGDNDKLSAMFALKVDADLLLLLTDIDGLYTRDPKKHKNAEKITMIDKITPAMERQTAKAGTFGSGGMKSKILAAKVSMSAGCPMIIANGRLDNILLRLVNGENIGTLFTTRKHLPGRQRWILTAKPKGKIIINENAEKALRKGTSNLLPIGIVKVQGDFKAGDVVLINDFAKAVPDSDSKDIDKIKGMSSKEAYPILKKRRGEVVKKDNIVFL